MSRKNLYAAVSNAGDARKLRVKERGHGLSKRASLWEVCVKPPKPAAQPPVRLPSVWALGTPPAWSGDWPPLGQGTQFLNLTNGDQPDGI